MKSSLVPKRGNLGGLLMTARILTSLLQSLGKFSSFKEVLTSVLIFFLFKFSRKYYTSGDPKL